MKSSHAWAAALFRDADGERGREVATVPLAVDWEPAREWARLLAARRGRMAPGDVEREAEVVPLWHRELGEPYLAGFELRLRLPGEGGETVAEFPSAYFRAGAEQAASALVAEGKLAEGEKFAYLATAYPAARPATPGATGGGALFEAEEVASPARVRRGALARFRRRARAQGSADERDLPFFLPAGVLAEAAELGTAAGACETGGILVGHLRRDRGGELFGEVTAQVPALRAEGSATRLTFSPEVWTEARAALDLRRRDELMLGWWHSHPVREWCKDCPPEKRRGCRLAADFLSAHDRLLQRAVFPRAWSVALVVNVVADGPPTFSFFGWREGLLQPRGFDLLAATAPAEREAARNDHAA